MLKTHIKLSYIILISVSTAPTVNEEEGWLGYITDIGNHAHTLFTEGTCGKPLSEESIPPTGVLTISTRVPTGVSTMETGSLSSSDSKIIPPNEVNVGQEGKTLKEIFDYDPHENDVLTTHDRDAKPRKSSLKDLSNQTIRPDRKDSPPSFNNKDKGHDGPKSDAEDLFDFAVKACFFTSDNDKYKIGNRTFENGNEVIKHLKTFESDTIQLLEDNITSWMELKDDSKKKKGETINGMLIRIQKTQAVAEALLEVGINLKIIALLENVYSIGENRFDLRNAIKYLNSEEGKGKSAKEILQEKMERFNKGYKMSEEEIKNTKDLLKSLG